MDVDGQPVAEETSAAIRREFYSDYRSSNYTLAQYIERTTQEA